MTRDSYRIAVFASGSGSNFQALADAIREGWIPGAELVLLVTDKPQAAVVGRAERANVPVFAFRPRDYASREAYEAEIVARLNELRVDLVVLAGYMRLVTQTLLTPFAGRIINLHPALLPAFPGVDGVRQALEYGVKVTGVTVHFVDDGLDTGPVLLQRAVVVAEDDTEETLAARIHAVEHELYPEAVRLLSEGRVRMEGRRVSLLSPSEPEFPQE
ncbi:phosphoribosylglycinamide formyltransferase [Gorillibacterium timonense]|uniref:phosphoribosylglycinamide formyltransferase n=1 Tax=Gorillibacterium timonense TaxID=1689269 RepID=UPI00071CCCF0|nr:phosphoribosylglycinamide formyltransferase [Gorillibacterium timonense]